MVRRYIAWRNRNADNPLVRYRPEHDDHVDGLPGGEGAFLACTFWLVDALHNIGRTDEAERIFERMLSLRNDVGLLSEEYDPPPAGNWATPRRRSAWSGWSTRPASSPAPAPVPRRRRPSSTPSPDRPGSAPVGRW